MTLKKKRKKLKNDDHFYPCTFQNIPQFAVGQQWGLCQVRTEESGFSFCPSFTM